MVIDFLSFSHYIIDWEHAHDEMKELIIIDLLLKHAAPNTTHIPTICVWVLIVIKHHIYHPLLCHVDFYNPLSAAQPYRPCDWNIRR